MKILPSCKYNRMVECKPENIQCCQRCGWNPAVRDQRIKIARKRYDKVYQPKEIRA